MEAVSLNINNQYFGTFQTESSKVEEKVHNESSSLEKSNESKIHNSAVNVSISMESIKVFLNIKSVELSQQNTTAQNSLMNIINNTEVYDFLSGKAIDGGFSLKSIGYDGKPITELSAAEAKSLISEGGFFSIEETSSRVSSFVMNIAGDSFEALEEAKKGIIRGFEEAEKMWGGSLPEISYQTQAKTLEIIDARIAELLKTDSQKEVEHLDS